MTLALRVIAFALEQVISPHPAVIEAAVNLHLFVEPHSSCKAQDQGDNNRPDPGKLLLHDCHLSSQPATR